MSDVGTQRRANVETPRVAPAPEGAVAAAELTVADVYDAAAELGREFERTIDRFGRESVVGVVPKVVRVLELLEALVGGGAAAREAEELRCELDRLRRERSDRSKQERRHQEELEQVEEVWRGEVQDLLSQIARLKAENKRLTGSVPLKESPIADDDDDVQKQEGTSEKERQAMKRFRDSVDKQRDELRVKDQELTLKSKDVEALQAQQHRLIRVNQDLRRRMAATEARGKALVQQRVESEAAARALRRQLGALRLEVTRLNGELRGWELEREVAAVAEASLGTCGTPSPSWVASPAVASSTSAVRPSSVWAECGGDPDFLTTCFEFGETPSAPPTPSVGGRDDGGEGDEDEASLPAMATETEPEPGEQTDGPGEASDGPGEASDGPGEASDSTGEASDGPHFTLQELRDVLQERNELKAQVFVLQEELAYYKSEEFEDDGGPAVCAPSPPPRSSSADPPESGIRRLIFTAIMPMMAAGLIADDPTLLPARRLLSSA